VGSHLLDHVYYAMVFEVDQRTLNREFTVANVSKSGWQLVRHGTGTATASMGHAMVFGSIDGVDVEFQGIFAPFGVANFKQKQNGIGRHKMNLMLENAVTVIVGLMHPHSEGSVHIQSPDPTSVPLVSFEHYSDVRDLDAHTAACRRMREIINTSPMGQHVIRELTPGPEVQDDEAWHATLRGNCTSGKHYVGTCRMGNTEGAVVDPQLRVVGIEGLRVIDASVVPALPAANTYAAAVMIGEKGADLVMAAGSKSVAGSSGRSGTRP
jgi:choline dehydrogenase